MLQELRYVRVPFIENPWYDDHFDIPTERQRIGKTLTMVAMPVDGCDDDIISRSYRLVGQALYEKFDRGLELMRRWTEEPPSNTQLVFARQSVGRVCLFTYVVKNVLKKLLFWLFLLRNISLSFICTSE